MFLEGDWTKLRFFFRKSNFSESIISVYLFDNKTSKNFFSPFQRRNKYDSRILILVNVIRILVHILTILLSNFSNYWLCNEVKYKIIGRQLNLRLLHSFQR